MTKEEGFLKSQILMETSVYLNDRQESARKNMPWTTEIKTQINLASWNPTLGRQWVWTQFFAGLSSYQYFPALSCECQVQPTTT